MTIDMMMMIMIMIMIMIMMMMNIEWLSWILKNMGLIAEYPNKFVSMETLANPFCSPYAYTYVICILLVRKSLKRISRSAVCSTWPKET